jgi:SAM-dependent methyltransferase
MPCSVPLSYHASDGAAYERFLGRWSERLAKVFADFAHLPARGSVLDVGCATGSVAAEVARRALDRNVVGVDVAEAYLDFARGRHRAPNLSFQYGDAAALPFADGRYFLGYRRRCRPFRDHSTRSLVFASIGSGFSGIESASLTIRMDYRDFDDYWEPLLGGQGPVGVYAASLNTQLRNRLRESVRGAFLSGRPDGMRSLAATAWVTRGIAGVV